MPPGMFTIGEFSKVTGLTVKTLRFYHEEGLLAPAYVDPQTGYRHYDERQAETARAIAFLRSLEFPVAKIRDLLAGADDDQGLLDAVERHKAVIAEQIKRLRRVARSLDEFISQERQARAMAQDTFDVQEKVLEPTLIAGIRMKGRYSECGKAFGRLGRGFGRFVCGKPLLLHYDQEYKEEDADFEAAMPVRQRKVMDGVSVRKLPGGRCVSLVHKGPYEQLGNSYAKVLRYVKEKGYCPATPTREVYIKGPGMIFRGNPKNYLTEIQILIEGAAASA